MEQKMKVEWVDFEREPRCAPNPNFPDGVDADTSEGAMKTCIAQLPYPAKRCGMYTVECPKCGIKVGCTTAGRPDDPRSIKIACYSQKLNPTSQPNAITGGK